MTGYDEEREALFDAITFWQGAVIHAKDEETRQFARDRITALRAMQDDQDAEELF